MNNINLKKIGWRILQALIILIINGCGIAILAMMFIGNGTITVELLPGISREVDYSFFETLRTIEKAGLILGEIIGIIASISFVFYLYNQNRQDKRIEKQTKALKGDKDERDISKYL